MLTQSEAEALIAMEKSFSSPNAVVISPGVDETYELNGADMRERFLLDLWRGMIRLSKLKVQTRGRSVVVLVRLDIDGAPHTNPDGKRLGGTHLHLYREGYEDKWAYPLDRGQFRNTRVITLTFLDFCRYCNVENIPPVQEALI